MNARRRRAFLRAVLVGAPVVVVAGGGCSRELTLGSDRPSSVAGAAGTLSAGSSGSGGSSGTAGSASVGGSAGEAPCVISTCRGKVYECGNCQDDSDGDGRIDAEDPECTGPCDDAEDSLSVGLPGESSAACQADCYFDSGNGAAGDCTFSQHCDELAIAPDYPPTGDSRCAYDEGAKIPGTSASCSDLRAEQPAGCLESCGPLTPNGCDCFGCCELPAGGGAYIWLETSLPCTPVDACLNRCDPCEACVGRPDPLPSCGGTGGDACSTAYRPCGGADGERCQAGAYCITGCCVPEPR